MNNRQAELNHLHNKNICARKNMMTANQWFYECLAVVVKSEGENARDKMHKRFREKGLKKID